jgi:hypothetical protein
MSYLAPSPVGGGAASRWALLTRTEQGVSPLDPSSKAPGATFDATTGLFTWPLQAGDTTLVDGFSDAMARWTVPVVTLYPDFDSSRDILDIAWVPTIPFTAGNVSRFGVAVGVLSGAAAGPYAGRMLGTTEAASGNYNNAAIGSSGPSGTDGVAATMDLQVSTWNAFGAGNFVLPGWRTRTGALWEEGPTVASTPIAADVSTWRIHIGHMHNTTTAALASTVTARVWHRRVRTSGLAGLP